MLKGDFMNFVSSTSSTIMSENHPFIFGKTRRHRRREYYIPGRPQLGNQFAKLEEKESSSF